MTFYNDEFYVDLHQQTLYPAKVILEIILNTIPDVRSAVDVGCAVGSWLSVLYKNGVKEIQGVDGDWVNEDFLEIPAEFFRSVDLTHPFRLDRKYDLALSLEVAEHLPESSAQGFVGSLTALSDFVVFSAAIPHQGGTNHINEQWLDYWNELFIAYGYQGIDIVRKQIWNDTKIPFWYKQNLILFVRKERVGELNLTVDFEMYDPISLVHPEQYNSGKVALRVLLDGLKHKLKGYL
jgi:hypothetical protein